MTTEPIYAESPAAGGRFGDLDPGLGVAGIGSIEFRVLRSGAPARRMRLNSTRCTLGSGEGCTVRLNDTSLRAMHAVILRDAHRVLLRAYTVPIEVNGHLTGETFLHLGDTFRLGSYHFQLVDGIDSPFAELEPAMHRTASVTAISSDHMEEEFTRGSVFTSTRANSLVSSEFDEGHRDSDNKRTPRNRPRLSFQGGSSFVSEAVQGFSTAADAAQTLVNSVSFARTVDLSVRDEQRGELDLLRKDLESWRQKEQDWKDQQARTNRELELAISRFHQSQERANEASDAVSELRDRIGQLTSELESLVKDSREYRQRERQLREGAEAAAAAREQAVRERNEAFERLGQAQQKQAEAERRQEIARQEREQALSNVELALKERETALRDRDRITAEFKQDSVRAGEASLALASANERLQSLTQELARATEQLRSTREEAQSNRRRIDELTREAESYRSQIAERDTAQGEAIRNYDERLQQLRSEIKRLESECADARQHASSAATDRQMVQSLQSRLNATETQRQADRRSWEEEAEALQQTIQQLSIEIATVTGQLQQSQSDNENLRAVHSAAQVEYEATQAELNQAYERLTLARRELTTRPTTQQWDELQNKLNETESLLEESEKQIAALKLEYDTLLVRHSEAVATATDFAKQSQNNLSQLPPASTAEAPAMDRPSSHAAFISPCPDDSPVDSDALDQGWPTYGKALEVQKSVEPTSGYAVTHEEALTHEDAEPVSEDWAKHSHQVADRLRSYTTHDEAQRQALSEPEHDEIRPWSTPSTHFASGADSYTEGASGYLPTSSEPMEPGLSDSEEAIDRERYFGHESGTEFENDISSHIADVDFRVDLPADAHLNDSSDDSESAAVEADETSGPEEPVLGSFAQRLIAELEGSRVSSSGTLSNKETKRTTESTSSWSTLANTKHKPDLPAPSSPTENRFAVTFPSEDREPESRDSLRDDDANSNEIITKSGSSISEMDQESFERTYVLSENEHQLGALSREEEASVSLSRRVGPGLIEQFADSENVEPIDGPTRAFDFESFDSKQVASAQFPLTREEASELKQGHAPEPEVNRAQANAATKSTSDAEDDDSIEAYMNRLLQRVQGHSGSSPETAATKSTPTPPVTESIGKFTSSTEVLPRDAETVTLSKPVEIIDPSAPLIPRSQAPEGAKNLAAMRELANSSANTAISLSVRGQAEQLKSRAIMDLLQGAVVLVCAFAFFACGVKIPTLRYVWFTASLLAASLAVFFVLDMVKKLSAAKSTYDRSLGRSNDDASDDEPTLPM